MVPKEKKEVKEREREKGNRSPKGGMHSTAAVFCFLVLKQKKLGPFPAVGRLLAGPPPSLPNLNAPRPVRARRTGSADPERVLRGGHRATRRLSRVD